MNTYNQLLKSGYKLNSIVFRGVLASNTPLNAMSNHQLASISRSFLINKNSIKTINSSNSSSLYKNEIIQFNKSNGFNNNNSNNNNYRYRSYSSSSSSSSNNNTMNNEEKVLIFEDIKPFKYKAISLVSFLQIGLLIGVFDMYFQRDDPSKLETFCVFGLGTAFVAASFYFLRKYAKNSIAQLYTYNKGRVVEMVSYNQFGNPNIRRTITINKLVQVKKNDLIKVVEPQKQNFYLKLNGTATYYVGDLEKAKILDPISLGKIIHNKNIISGSK